MHSVADRIASRKKGRSLEREFYTSPEIFSLDLERVFFRDWLYVGHVSQVPQPGDFLNFQIGDESILITRANEGQVNAFFNVCRHRGARIVQESCGHAAAFRCPYHSWTYGLDGSLKAAPGMSEQLSKETYGLHPAWLDVWQGFLYVHLSDKRPVETMTQRLAPAVEAVAGHRFPELKIAKTIQYDVPANWKLIMENYRECYHCRAAHPQFCATVPVDELEEHRSQSNQRLIKQRYGTFTRYDLRPGAVSQSVSGEAVSIPLGDRTQKDTTLRAMCFYPGHAMVFGVDYGWAFGLQPRSATETTLTAHWYVNKHAIQGRDYNPDSVAEFWDVTTRQDIYLCTINQQGVNSRRYTPGPYNPGQEDDLDHFLDYYMEKLQQP